MKIKYAIFAMCLSALMLVFASCTPEDNGGGGQTPTCNHSYVDGVCELCGVEDPDYKPDDSGNNDEQNSEDDNSKIPPIDIGGETELPFVPAK